MAVTVDYVNGGGPGGYVASQDRQSQTALLAKTAALTSKPGIIPSDGTDFAVTQNGTPNMTVNVAKGQLIAKDASGGAYLFTLDALQNTAIAASDPTNPRLDLIIARVYDNEAGDGVATQSLTLPGTAGTTTVQQWTGKVEVVQGTPGGVPAEPALPNVRCVVLRRVRVRAATASILTADIETASAQIAFTASAGGILPVRDGTDQATIAGYDGLWIDRIDVNQLLRHDGAAFIVSARSGGPLGWQGEALGPAGTVDCLSTFTDLSTVSVPVVLNRRYKVTGFANGQQQTSTGVSQTKIIDDQSGSRIIAYNPALAAGGILLGTGVHWFTANSTRTAVLKVQGTTTAGALRVIGTAAAAILVEDMGT